jgi:phosphate uptake regulator
MIETILYRVGVLGVLMLMCFFAGLGVGAHCMEKKLLEDHEALIQKSRQIEQELIQEQDSVVREYTQKIRDMEERYAEDIESIRNSQLADTVSPPECVQQPAPSNSDKRLPAKAENKSGLTCYTEDQLRSKIESSLALARECDKEMTRFQALIEACQK